MPNLNKRQGDIYHIIQERESVEVHDLIAMFDVSAATIRKDLTLLEQSGLVFRTHGEVHIANQNERILSFESRSSLRTEAKKAIAQEAVKTIHEGDSIILDSGSTTLAIAELLRDFQHLTVITNSVPAALTLNNTQLLVIMVGGILHGQNLSIQGPEAEKYLSQIEADKAFICSSGVRKDVGLVTSNSLEGRVKHCMIKAAHKVYAVLDSAKFTTGGIDLFADFSELDCVITEKSIQDPAIQARLQALGTEVIVAE